MDILMKALDLLGNPVGIRATKRGKLYTIKHLPDMASLVAANRAWRVTETATTTAATALPTTTAGVTLQNGEEDNDKLLIVLATFVAIDVNAASLETVGLAQMQNRNPVADFTRDIAQSAVHAMKAGGGLYPGKAIFDLGATVVDDGWAVVGPQVANVKNSAAWGQLFYRHDIPIVLEAKCAVSTEIISSSGTTEGAIGHIFAEVDKDELE